MTGKSPTASMGHQIVFAFCSPLCYFAARRFQQVLGVTSCPKTETCHPECIINDIAPKKPSSGINEMVIFSFHYVSRQWLGAFPAPRSALRACSKNLLSSTEV